MFRVVEDSMRPTLGPGDGLSRCAAALRRGQLRVFPDPRLSTRWLVKRVGDVYGSGRGAIFEARSDNPGAAGAADSHEFGWVPAAGSYRVVWTAEGQSRPLALVSSCAPALLAHAERIDPVECRAGSKPARPSSEHEVAEARWRRGPVGRSKSPPSIRGEH